MKKEYHFIKEIREQPEVIRKSLEGAEPDIKEIAQKYVGKVERIIMTGCGDPYMPNQSKLPNYPCLGPNCWMKRPWSS